MTEETRKKRILIVDDDPSLVQMLSDILIDEGYEVVTATQSLRAFDRAKESVPDLILMDIMMPYLDGLDQIKLLSLDEDVCLIPVIVITAKARALDGIDDLRALRIMDYLYKPFEIQTLLDKITYVLSGEIWPADLVRIADYMPKGNPYKLEKRGRKGQEEEESIAAIFRQSYIDQYPDYASLIPEPGKRYGSLVLQIEPALRSEDGQPDPDARIAIYRFPAA